MNTSFQLYSARSTNDWPGVIETLGNLGYTQVEGFGDNYDDPGAFRALLDKHGLAMPSGHFFPINCLEDDLTASLAAAKTLSMERLFVPAPEDAYRVGVDVDVWIDLARRLETVCKTVQDAGYRFGWHNHDWEFVPLANGALPIDLIFEHAPSVEWEIDVAWVIKGGQDTVKWITNHADRITTAHIKDIAADGEKADEDGWEDVGHGIIEWAPIMAALRAAEVDLFVMEHDKPNDIDRFATRSLANFKDF